MPRLDLRLVRATNLPSEDVVGKVDPYVVVVVDGRKYRAKSTIEGSQNPVWNEIIRIPITLDQATSADETLVTFGVWDADWDADDCVGAYQIALGSVPQDGRVEERTVKLQYCKNTEAMLTFRNTLVVKDDDSNGVEVTESDDSLPNLPARVTFEKAANDTKPVSYVLRPPPDVELADPPCLDVRMLFGCRVHFACGEADAWLRAQPDKGTLIAAAGEPSDADAFIIEPWIRAEAGHVAIATAAGAYLTTGDDGQPRFEAISNDQDLAEGQHWVLTVVDGPAGTLSISPGGSPDSVLVASKETANNGDKEVSIGADRSAKEAVFFVDRPVRIGVQS